MIDSITYFKTVQIFTQDYRILCIGVFVVATPFTSRTFEGHGAVIAFTIYAQILYVADFTQFDAS